MAVFRVAFRLKTNALHAPKLLLKNATGRGTTYGIMACTFGVRNISSVEVTKNIELIQKEKRDVKIVNLKLVNPEEKPLVVMLSWLMAKRKHIYKYASFYLNHGFDVLNISITPWQLLWPAKGTQVVAADILKFLDVNVQYSPLLLHGFSVGGYVWGEVLVQMAAQKERYEHVLKRIAAQIWDSVADITEIAEGVPFAVFPKNAVMQAALKQYMLYHLKTFDKVATCHYVRASQLFHTNIVKAPALFLLSKTDPVGSERSIQRARETWENIGIDVYWKCWDKSPHVGHYQQHPQEYIAELNNILLKSGLISNAEKIQAKL